MHNLLKELNLSGVFAPPMFLYMIIALIIWAGARRAMGVFGVYDFVAHKNLFLYAVYAIILSIVTIVILTLGM